MKNQHNQRGHRDSEPQTTKGGKPINRRSFLKNTGLVSAAGIGASVWMSPEARAFGGRQRDVFVQIFLRGGMDGLTTCVPYGDNELYQARPGLAIAPPGSVDGAIDLNGFFGLAPSAAGFMTPYQNGHLAVIHAAGSTDPTRSHFDAFVAMERGAPEQEYHLLDTGWLGRHLAAVNPIGDPALRALAMTDTMPIHLDGAPDALPIPDPATFSFPGDPQTASLRERTIREMYASAPDLMAGAADSTFDTLDEFGLIDFANYVPSNGAVYPASPFGTQLLQAAALIKAGIGVEAISLDYGGWDHHNDLGPIDGTMAGMLGDLSSSVEAFYLDMGSYLSEVTLAIVSEFGRRVAQNGSLGVDHGHGNCMFLMGHNVVGGQVHSNWPGLAPGNLDQGDLAITTDYRNVFGEILEKRMGSTDLGAVFPNHTFQFPGLIL